MKIRIIQVGKTKSAELTALADEYTKRISPFASVDFVTVKEAKTSKTFSVEKAVEEEGWAILEVVDQDSFVVALDEHGRQFRSLEFADLIKDQREIGLNVDFVIGGAFGLSDVVTQRANLKLSLSKMTFTHEMARVFLLEQIYRAFSIINNKKYHNE